MKHQTLHFGLNPSLDDIYSVLEHPPMTFRQLSQSIKPFLKPAEKGFFDSIEGKSPYKSLAELKKDFVSSFQFKDDVDNNNLPPVAKFFASIIQNMQISDLIQDLLDTPVINPADILMLMPQNVCNIFVAIALLFRDLHGNQGFLLWISHLLVPANWHKNPSAKNSKLIYLNSGYLKGTFRRHKNPSWLLYDNEKVFHVFGIHHNFDDATIKQPIIDSVSKDKVNISSADKQNSITLVFDSSALAEQFAKDMKNPPPFPLSLIPFHGPYPTSVVEAFYEAITSNDMYVLRAVLSCNVMSVIKGKQYIPHLVRIFCRENHMQRLLSAFAALEFTRENLTQNTVLRSNSHLTTLFKYYSEKFGGSYFKNVIKPICLIIDAAGDIGWKNSRNADLPKISKILLGSLEKIVNSGQFIPIELRHMAHVLKMGLLARFQTRRAIFNALCGFFCLRFMTAEVLDPLAVEPDMKLQTDPSLTLIPFAQILQIIMNLQTLEDKFDFDAETEKSLRIMLCRIYNFVSEIPEMDGKEVKYPVPTRSETIESLEEILGLIADKKEEFLKYYKYIISDQNDVSPAQWRIAEFIVHCFDE